MYVEDFRLAALCAADNADAERWFPFADPRSDVYRAQVADAKAGCAACPVRAECLADVLGWERPGYRHGVYGGLDPAERDALVVARRDRATAAA